MFSITNFPKLRISKRNLLKQIDEEIERIWKNAIAAFVRAVALSGVVRVDTGMSRASLIPLARVVRLGSAVNRSISSDGASNANRARKPYQEGGIKSRARGIRLGERAFKVEINRNNLLFEFEITVFQYRLQENGFKFNPLGWRSLQLGRRAFLISLDNDMPDFNRRVKRIVEGNIS